MKTIIKQILVVFGLFNGMWFFLGSNPAGPVNYPVLDIVATQISNFAVQQTNPTTPGTIGILFYDVIGGIAVFGSWLWAYLVGGLKGLLVVAMAFAGGLLLGSFGIWLFVGAFLIAPFLPVRENEQL